MAEIVGGQIVDVDRSGLTIRVPYDNWERYITRKYEGVRVELVDERARTLEQMRNNLPSPDSDPIAYRKAVSSYNSYKGRNERAIARHETQKTEPTFDTTVHLVRVGDIAFCTTRFELYMDFMHRLQARSPFIQTFVIQLAGDATGTYLSTERGTANKGYSASLFCNTVSAEGGQQWVDESLKVLGRMAEEA